MNIDTNAEIDSTPMDDSIAEVNNGQTEDALLADIVRNSDFVGSLPDEQVPELDPEESNEEDPESFEEADSEEVEEEVEEEDANTEEEDADDESATDESDVYATEDLDLEAKVVVKVDGEFTEVSFGDLIKGYSTEQTKVEELGTMSKASAAVLYSNEQALATQYHELETQINKARKDGDTYEVNELKDKREQVQKNYWDARKQREGLVEQISKQEQLANETEWKEQLDYFNETIPTLIPDFNEETAGSIRQFAIDEGISPEVLDSIADPIIVKFVDDYRRLKQGVTKGAVKRKSTPSKKAPLRKAKSVNKQKEDAREATRRRTLSGQASPEEEKDFLRSLAERSLNL